MREYYMAKVKPLFTKEHISTGRMINIQRSYTVDNDNTLHKIRFMLTTRTNNTMDVVIQQRVTSEEVYGKGCIRVTEDLGNLKFKHHIWDNQLLNKEVFTKTIDAMTDEELISVLMDLIEHNKINKIYLND